MTSTPYMKVTRHICAAQLKLRHFARKPTDTIDSAEVKAEGEILDFCLRINPLTTNVSHHVETS